MQIALIASEVAPFSKTGGLGDVVGALPKALADLGHDLIVFSPCYRLVRENSARLGLSLEQWAGGPVSVPVGDSELPAGIVGSNLPGSHVRVCFLENDRYYDRDGLYSDPKGGADFQDNSERFVFLSRGALVACAALGLQPDVFHCHDWQTGLVPVYLNALYRGQFPRSASAFTVHNVAYQGIFWHWDMRLTGLDWELFNWRMLEYYGDLCFLKAGLVGADVLTTVSKKYAEEIQTDESGAGMQGVLRERSTDLFGIVNGVDYTEWNPETDPWIASNFSAEDPSGKEQCKESLQAEFNLAQEPSVPLIGLIGRLSDQKGFDLFVQAVVELAGRDVQFVVLGVGEPRYHGLLSDLAAQFPKKVGLRLDFSEETAHHVEAGSDMFLMPSRYEPCGLNQLYSLKYGTVPIVRATGGLADTVVDYSEEDNAPGKATGFVFQEYSSAALLAAVNRALRLYEDREKWRQLMLTGMEQDWSWTRSAAEYVEVYEKAAQKVAGA